MRFTQILTALALAATAAVAPIVLTGTAAHAEATDTTAVVLQNVSEDGGNWDE